MLKSLECPRKTIGSTLLSSIVKVRNLVTLRVHTCHCDGVDGCSSRMTDVNVKGLATVPPRLNSLLLGQPCGSEACTAATASLVSISVH